MTREEAARNQAEIAKHFNLGYWYGTKCKKCCGVYPKFHTSDGNTSYCWYECEVCGKRTRNQDMSWQAERDWNNDQFLETQIRMF